MKFVYEYRTSDNERHADVVSAPNRDAAYRLLKERNIKPSRLVEAPGFWNALLGKGKRWLAIAALSLLAAGIALFAVRVRDNALQTADVFDATTRRQPIGDLAVIEDGVRTGWSQVFETEGERFLASFAVPGVEVAVRNTTEDEIRKVLGRKAQPSREASEGIEARQIRAMVEGMKQELREFLADGGTIAQYGKQLVARQEQELGYYRLAKNEIMSLLKDNATTQEVVQAVSRCNARLRRLGIRPLVLSDGELR